MLFNVHVKEIKERDLPPLDDEFVKEASEFETLDELRAAVREQLEAAAEQRVGRRVPGARPRRRRRGCRGRGPRGNGAREGARDGRELRAEHQVAGDGARAVLPARRHGPRAFEERVRPDAEDTVKKELVLDAVAAAEGIVADEDEVMHEIGHLAEDSERSAEEIAEMLRANGTYAMLEEEISRQKALDFLVENAVPVPMPEERDGGRGARR